MLDYITKGIGYLCLIGVFGVVSNYVYITSLSVCKFVYKVFQRIYLSIKSYIEYLWIKYFTNWEPSANFNTWTIKLDRLGELSYDEYHNFINLVEIDGCKEDSLNYFKIKNKVIEGRRILIRNIDNSGYYVLRNLIIQVNKSELYDLLDFFGHLTNLNNVKLKKEVSAIYTSSFLKRIIEDYLRERGFEVNPQFVGVTSQLIMKYLVNTRELTIPEERYYWRPLNTPEYKTDLILTIGSIMVSTLVSVVLFLLS